MRRSAIFLIDGRRQSGGGHLTRSRVLANALQKLGWSIRSVVRTEKQGSCATLEKCHSPRDYIEMIDRDRFDLAIVDDYEITAKEETEFKKFTGSIAVLEDRPNRTHDCDILIDPTFGRTATEYAHLVSADCIMLLGTRHALLDSAFAELRQSSLARRRSGAVEKIAISFGMIDKPNSTRLALLALQALGGNWDVDVVFGPAYAYRQELCGLINSLGATARTIDTPLKMARLLSGADLAIGAAGSTTWERCCLGLPSVVLINAINQKDIGASLDQECAALVCGAATDVSVQILSDAILRIVNDPMMYQKLSTAAAKMCDGLGSGRVAAVIDQWASA